jgi:hypothetical protein
MPGTKSFQHFYIRALLDSNRGNKRPRIEVDRISNMLDDVSCPSNDSADESHHLASDGVHSTPSTLASRSHIDTNGTSLRNIDLEQNLLEESLDGISFHSLESSASNANKESEDDLGFTKHDCFVHELITVCDASGAPRHFYDTYDNLVKDPTKEVLLALILYGDKTGTDVNQRYALEPWMFNFANIPRDQREDRRYWCHLGFIPDLSIDEKEKSLETRKSITGVFRFYLPIWRSFRKTRRR